MVEADTSLQLDNSNSSSTALLWTLLHQNQFMQLLLWWCGAVVLLFSVTSLYNLSSEQLPTFFSSQIKFKN